MKNKNENEVNNEEPKNEIKKITKKEDEKDEKEVTQIEKKKVTLVSSRISSNSLKLSNDNNVKRVKKETNNKNNNDDKIKYSSIGSQDYDFYMKKGNTTYIGDKNKNKKNQNQNCFIF